MPMTNALGYYQNVREENGVDPNRDFPYNTDQCMVTVTARAVNEVWKRHLFQLAATYHGGMEAIAYEWGAFNHYRGGHTVSPDDAAQTAVAQAMASFGGPLPASSPFNSNGGLYPTGRLNDLVYPVNGGMEDWAYAAGWEDGIKGRPCAARPGYPSAQTAAYPEGTLRAFNFLVETSNDKQPAAAGLGTSEGLLVVSAAQATGHVQVR